MNLYFVLTCGITHVLESSSQENPIGCKAIKLSMGKYEVVRLQKIEYPSATSFECIVRFLGLRNK